MNIRERLFLVSGRDFVLRQRALEGIKKRALEKASRALDTRVFYGDEIDIGRLPADLCTGSFGRTSLIIFKNFTALTSPARDFLFANIKKIISAAFLVFETEEDLYWLKRDKKIMADKLFALLLTSAALINAGSARYKNPVSDFLNSLRANDLAWALAAVEGLFLQGENEKILGPQLIGMLTKQYAVFPEHARTQKRLRSIWEADRAIKEKGRDARVVIEALLVRLMS